MRKCIVFVSFFLSTLYLIYHIEAVDEDFEMYRNSHQDDEKSISSECIQFLRNLSSPTPVLLIDTHILRAVQSGKCRNTWSFRITVAISDKEVQADESQFEYITMKDDETKDYFQFLSDPMRIVPKNFKTHQIGNISIPENIEMFLGFWRRSLLKNCLSLYIPREKKTGHQFNHGKAAAEVLAELRNLLFQFQMHPFLNGGTLLGWYRECQFIPHTGDIDLAVFAEDFNPAIVNYLRSTASPFRLIRKLGLMNDSFELTVQSKNGYAVSIDVFLMYRDMENNGEVTNRRWVGGTKGGGGKFKYIYPEYDPWCAADLHGHLFWVTCSPQKMIPFEYGPLWYQDVSSDEYAWEKSSRNVMPNGRWSREMMQRVYKIY